MPYAKFMISVGKGLYKAAIKFCRFIDNSFKLGNHNVLLETNYDLRVLN